jgi:hypothetical protein
LITISAPPPNNNQKRTLPDGLPLNRPRTTNNQQEKKTPQKNKKFYPAGLQIGVFIIVAVQGWGIKPGEATGDPRQGFSAVLSSLGMPLDLTTVQCTT